MKLNTNYFYFFNENDREKARMENILAKLNIHYMPIKVVPSKVDEKFVELMLEFCENGFDDLIKNPKKVDFGVGDIYDLKYSELVTLITENPEKYLKPAWFLGNSGGNGVLTSKGIEDEFTVYLKYSEREMSEIYG
jgi:hypothetical protein